MKGLFDWPRRGSLGYFIEVCQKPIPHRDPMTPRQSSE
jgi:hypothetical protein